MYVGCATVSVCAATIACSGPPASPVSLSDGQCLRGRATCLPNPSPAGFPQRRDASTKVCRSLSRQPRPPAFSMRPGVHCLALWLPLLRLLQPYTSVLCRLCRHRPSMTPGRCKSRTCDHVLAMPRLVPPSAPAPPLSRHYVCVYAYGPHSQIAAPVMSAPYTVIPAADLVLGEELGRGAFGIVRRATFRGRPVCAKVRHTHIYTHAHTCKLTLSVWGPAGTFA